MTVKELEKQVKELEKKVEDLLKSFENVTHLTLDAILATQQKVGIDKSKDKHSLDYRVTKLEETVIPIHLEQ